MGRSVEVIELSSDSSDGSKYIPAAHTNRQGGIKFFKIVIPSTCLLQIPIVRKLKFTLPNLCVLRTPNGAEFSAVKKVVGDEQWFEKGWADLCRHFNVGLADVVTLEYMGKGVFDVALFHTSTFEFHYDGVSNSHQSAQGKPSEQWSTRFFRVLNDLVHLCKLPLPALFVSGCEATLQRRCVLRTPDGSRFAVVRKKEKGLTYLCGKWQELCKRFAVELTEFIVVSYAGEAVFDITIFGHSSLEIDYSTQDKPSAWKSGIKEQLPLWDTKNATMHASFTTTLTEGCLKKYGQLWIPQQHRASELDRPGVTEVSLVLGQNVQLVKLIRCRKGIRFGRGWPEFAAANLLSKKMKCAFTLVGEEPLTYLVKVNE